MYILYTNSVGDVLPDGINFKVYADYIKMYTEINGYADAQKFQCALDKFYEWSNTLDLKLSVEKCSVLHIGHRNQRYDYTLNDTVLCKTVLVCDLGVKTGPTLKYPEHRV